MLVTAYGTEKMHHQPEAHYLRPGEVISYTQLCQAEGFPLRRGMNFKLRGRESVCLMSVREKTPYRDRTEQNGQVLIYEGHGVPKPKVGLNPK